MPIFETFERLRSLWMAGQLEIRDELRSKTYHTPYHVLTAVGLFLAAANPNAKGMPKGRVLHLEPVREHTDRLLQLACRCVQQAFERAAEAAESDGGFLAIENWLKSRDAVRGAREMTKVTYGVLSTMSDGLAQAAKLPPEMFHVPTDDED